MTESHARHATHAIEQLEVALAFGSEDTALSQQGWLEQFVKRDMLSLIENVFDEFDAGMADAQVLSIERIEIDLGATAGSGDDLVLASRLRERLRWALGDAHAAAPERGYGASAVPASTAELQSVLRFLASGRLRWSDTEAIDALARRVARRDAAALEAELLQAGPPGEMMRRRWVAQFGVDNLPELAHAWVVFEQTMTGHARPGWQRAWAILFSRRPASLRSLLAHLGRHAHVRRRLLAALSPAMRAELFALLAGPNRGSLAALVADALQRHSGAETVLWECLLAHLCMEGADAALPLAQVLADWAGDLNDPAMSARLQLEAIEAGAGAQGLAAAWRVLWRHDRAGLRRLVRERGRRGAFRTLTARQVPLDMRDQLLQLLAPGEGEAIGAFMAQACAWQARTQPGSPTIFGDWLWQQALALLAVPGAALSAASCIATLLQKIAEAQHVAAAAIAAELQIGVRGTQPGLAASQQLLRILQRYDERPAVAIDQRIATLCSRLQRQVPLSIDECRHWQAEAGLLLAQHPAALRPALRAALGAPQAASRLTALLPASMLEDVLRLLRPRDYAQARQCVNLVARACEVVDPTAPSRVAPLGWQFLLRELVDEGRRFAAAAFSGRFLDYLGDKLRSNGQGGWREAVRRAADRLAGAAAAPMAREVATGLAQRERDTLAADVTDPAAGCDYLANAGLVLLEPYLPRLFTMLDLLKDQRFVDETAEERALHLLHFIATGEEGAPETALLLPKLLCGVDATRPVAREVGLLPREREAAEGLLVAAIAHWKALGSTSIAGLRETFLQREARLLRDAAAWRLEVATGQFDMLLDHLPWGYGTIKLPWMPEVLYVEWR